MDTTISNGVSLDSLIERIGVGENETLRSSGRRKNYLQKYARLMTGVPVRLLLHPQRADCSYDDEGLPHINVPTKEHEQPITEFPPRIFEMLMQETITTHEIGHVLHTDFQQYEAEHDILEDEGYGSFRAMFKMFVNCMEDGAIEAQLRGQYNVANEMLILHSNLIERSIFGTEVGDMGIRYTFHEAAITALMDMCVYDTGRLRAILDTDDEEHLIARDEDYDLFVDFLDELQSHAATVLSEQSGTKRMEKMGEFFRETYLDYIADAEVGGVSQARNKSGEHIVVGKPNDFEGMDGAGGSVVPIREPEDATSLPSEEEIEEALQSDSKDEEGENDGDGDGSGADGTGDEDAEMPGSIVGSIEDQDADQMKAAVEADFQAEVQREAEEEAGSALMDEIEEFHSLINGKQGGDGPLKDLEIDIPDEKGGDYDRWQHAKRRSRIIARILKRRLQRQRRTKIVRNERRGKFDRRNLTKAARGNPRIFKRKKEPDIKDYSCLIVQDRSSSMSGNPTTTTENAVGALAQALNDVGVDVSIIDMLSYTPRLVLPFGGNVEDRYSSVFSGAASGGTPLSQVIELGRHRLQRMATSLPFMIVVTDGYPANETEYCEQLDACNFPVVGVTVGVNDADYRGVDATDYFHRHIRVEDMDELYRKLQQIAEELMF